MIKEFYAEAYAISTAGLDFEELGLSVGETESTNTEVYVIPERFQPLFGESLKVVGYMGPGWSLFTEE